MNYMSATELLEAAIPDVQDSKISVDDAWSNFLTERATSKIHHKYMVRKRFARWRFGRNTTIALVVGLMLTGSAAAAGILSSSDDSIFGPAHFTMQPLTYAKGDNPKSLDFGTTVSVSGPPSSTMRNRLDSFQATQYIGNVGWAIANLGKSGNGYEYPLYSTDHGKTWTTDGPYFHGPWADAPAWVGSLRAYSANFAVAYSQGGQTLYATDDGGRHWYSSFAFSYIVSVSHTMSTSSTLATGTIRIAVSKTGNAPAQYMFTSNDGGRTWVRHAG
jgi:hypothetical protein